MAFTTLILIALLGAAALGFLCAWYLQARNIDLALRETKETKSQLEEKQTVIDRLAAESETQKLSIENLQKQLQTLENELIKSQSEVRVMEGEMNVLEREKHKLELENAQLEFEVKNNIREIEVIREIPVYVSSEKGGEGEENGVADERIESAKRLVKAFQKGVSENQENPIV